MKLISQADLNIQAIDETACTFIENALLKARHASLLSGLPAVADDSGLLVPALDNAPGIYSARFAGLHASDEDNVKKLLHDLQHMPDEKRSAIFYCVLVFIEHAKDPDPLIAEGRWHGIITKEPKGSHGFGYDPIFYVPSEKKTAAELSLAIKNKISHRGIALQQLAKKISETL